MLTINWKQIYEINLNNTSQWILILYDISKNHYVGIPVYSTNAPNSILIKSINKYIILDEINDFNRGCIKRCIYIKGKPLKIKESEFNDILSKSKINFCDYVKNNTDNTPDGISYNKWCKDKLILMNNKNQNFYLKVGAICWVDLGYNIGNELRKLRPAILWRSSSNKEMWTVIPLTSKRKGDNYYFHYDMDDKTLGTARIENLINISSNRIREPYFVNNKIATITKKDNDSILQIIKKYYAFEDINSEKLNVKKCRKSEKVLT